MYNRYIREPDGSYRRRPMPETPMQPAPVPPPAPPRPEPPASIPQQRPPRPIPPRPQKPPEAMGSFLRQLLPKSFDAEDLLIVLLLLLMSGDCKEDQNTALLTLMLYLFL